MKRMGFWQAAVAAGAVVAGCAGEAEPVEPAGGDDGTSGGEAEPAPAITGNATDWAGMTKAQKAAFMQARVLPEMKAIFQEFDGQRFAEFNCQTCHGANMQEVQARMPNTLAPLDPAQIPGMFQSEEPIARLMTQRVWPKMTELLGLQPYDQTTQQGFSCLNCHATRTTPAASK